MLAFVNTIIISIVVVVSRGSAVGIASGYGLDDRESEFEARWCLSRISTSPYHPDWLWGPPNLLSNGTLHGGKAAGA
jgi:hypothetical protein